MDMHVPELGDVRMDMRMLGTKMYMRMPAGSSATGLPGGKQWIGMDLGKSLEQVGLGSFDFTRQQDPAQMLQYLRAASADVGGGYDDVRGVPTTRTPGRLDLRKALDAGLDELGISAAEQQQAVAGMKEMLEQLGSATVPFEVFVDDDGLLRRMTMTMSMTVRARASRWR